MSLTTNHEHERRRHLAHLATPGIAPGPRLNRRIGRRRIDWVGWLAAFVAAVVITGAIYLTAIALQHMTL